MNNKELIGKNCILYKNLDLLGKKWMIFLLLEMAKDPDASYRYRDFERILPGVTSRAISMRLDEMVCNGLISKTKLEMKNIVISYRLTQAGLELIPILEQLQHWANKFETCHPKEEDDCDRCSMFEYCKE